MPDAAWPGSMLDWALCVALQGTLRTLLQTQRGTDLADVRSLRSSTLSWLSWACMQLNTLLVNELCIKPLKCLKKRAGQDPKQSCVYQIMSLAWRGL